jgi:hypothetical protein
MYDLTAHSLPKLLEHKGKFLPYGVTNHMILWQCVLDNILEIIKSHVNTKKTLSVKCSGRKCDHYAGGCIIRKAFHEEK